MRSSRWRWWLVPDVALLGAAFTVLYACAFFDAPQRLFRDSDTGWHIRTGEAILRGGELPRADPYSWSKPGGEWFAWEWAADAAMGWAHFSAGLPGVALLYVGALAAATWLWFRLTWAAGGHFLLACALLSPFLSTANMHWLARPHVFGWLLLAAWVWRLETFPARLTWPAAAVVALFGAAWANVHASFLLLPVTAVLYAAGEFLGAALWTPAAPHRGRALLASAGAGLAGTLLNPYGYRLHQHVAAYLTNRELLERIGEFQSFQFQSEGSLQILATVLLAVTGAVLSFSRQRIGRGLVLAAFTVLALRNARGLPILALLLPLVNASLTATLAAAQGLRPGVTARIGAFLRYGANLRALEAPAGGYALVPVLAVLAWFAVGGAQFPKSDFPVEEAAAVASLPESARILAPDKFGGYLIYRFDGRRKVFFDGRSDYYGVAFMKRYIDLVQVRPGWDAILRQTGATHALLPNQYSLVPVLTAHGWRQLHRGEAATLFRAP